ncbi:SCO2400 family protein [Streptomyces sp. NPDC002004]
MSTERSQMDYCSSCRRNLNGALVCPGCGEYAPDIAPPARHGDTWGAATTAWDPWTRETPFSAEPRHAIDDFDAPPAADAAAFDEEPADAPDSGADTGFDGASGTGVGRAARRRQLARWKKHKRRAAAATAFAIAGGALTVALLPDKPSANATHATAAPEPRVEATPRTENTDASTQQSDERASRHTGAHRSTEAATEQHANASAPATAYRQPASTATNHPLTSTDAAPRSAPAHSATTTHSGGTGAAASSGPAAPASGGSSNSGSSNSGSSGSGSSDSGSSQSGQAPAAQPTQPAQPSQATPPSGSTSATPVCVLGVVCIG